MKVGFPVDVVISFLLYLKSKQICLRHTNWRENK